MKLIDLFRLSFRNFKTQKSRSILTVLGIGVGIGAILFLVAMGHGLQGALIQKITTSEALLTLDVSVAPESVLKITKQTIDEVSKIQVVKEVSPAVDITSQITYQGITADTTAHFIDSNFFRLSGIQLDSGTEFQSDYAKEIVISSAIATLLNLPQDEKILDYSLDISSFIAVDDFTIEELKLTNFKIIGVVDDEFVSYIYLPIHHLENQYEITEYSNFKVMVDDAKNLEQAREKIMEHGLTVAALSDIVDQANKVFRIMQIILGIFGVISLVVAAIGMFNTMTIALLERTQEIGIMKTIGASNIDIWGLFLFESMIIGLLGGISGVAIGFLGGTGVNMLLNFIAQRLGGEAISLFAYPIWFVLTIVIFSMVIGAVTGFYPSKRAANLNALDALRYK